jgi:hypothetical protein
MLNRYPTQALFAMLCFVFVTLPAFGRDDSILKHLKSISTVASTVPANGDVNPSCACGAASAAFTRITS